MNGLRIGSLFSGYGGLDMAVQAVLGGELVWYSEIDPGACAVLQRHHQVPNLGDVTGVDWSAVPPVDVLTGGFPCTDLSTAGAGAGLRHGTRSGLWFHMAHAISVLRPPLVVIENVRGLLSREADSDLEPCPWCLGDRTEVPVLRALGAVLGALADLGYDTRWHGLRAADIGAPHPRYRIFITATHTDRVGRERSGPPRNRVAGPAHHGATPAHTTGTGRGRPGSLTPAPAQGAEPETVRAVGRSGGPPAPYTDRTGRQRTQPAQRHHLPARSAGVQWGHYAPAVHRWETVLGRPAPAPTIPGRTGPVLNPMFVEWLMGLPEGHVTATPGLSRNQMLRILGNGVVPRQGTAAIRHLLPDTDTATVTRWAA